MFRPGRSPLQRHPRQPQLPVLLPEPSRLLSLCAGLLDQLDAGARLARLSHLGSGAIGGRDVDRNDPYLILLRRELTRALARLKRAERERDRALATIERLHRSDGKSSRRRTAKRPRPKRR